MRKIIFIFVLGVYIAWRWCIFWLLIKVAFHFHHFLVLIVLDLLFKNLQSIWKKIAHRINLLWTIKLYAHVYTSCMYNLNINLLTHFNLKSYVHKFGFPEVNNVRRSLLHTAGIEIMHLFFKFLLIIMILITGLVLYVDSKRHILTYSPYLILNMDL